MNATNILAIGFLLAGALGCDSKPTSKPDKGSQPPPVPARQAVPGTAPAPAAPSAAVPAASGSGSVSALGLSFTVPAGWQSMPPANSMRLAELHIPHESGDAKKTCLIVFSSAGGDVQANIDRWSSQVRDASGQPAKAAVATREVGGMSVNIAEMTGSFSPGMSDSNTYENWTLRGAILETPSGLLFIKMTGPAEQVAAAASSFDAMIDGLRK
jgi:hypothetical protein